MRGGLQIPTDPGSIPSDQGSAVLEVNDVASEGVPCEPGHTLADTLVR